LERVIQLHGPFGAVIGTDEKALRAAAILLLRLKGVPATEVIDIARLPGRCFS
jgi:hypothetical protein